uniref:Metal transporter CNNM2 n=2 Tax=Bursaphelenchus xylophilus TaxID=6326 RepID=A0A1I7SCQ6_BURXY
MLITFPLAYPIGKILDWLLGEDLVGYDRRQLLELLKLTPKWDTTQDLAEDLKIAVGAMEIADKSVQDVMTPIEDVFMLSTNAVLNKKNVSEILKRGYTRIPVYEDMDRNTIVSLLFVQDLALLDPEDNFPVQTVCKYYNHVLRFVAAETNLHNMLEEFKTGDYHLAIVQDDEENAIGIITLEDIVEEILQAEIIDESDTIIDNRYRQKRARKVSRVDAGIDTELKSIGVSAITVIANWLRSNFPVFQEQFLETRALVQLIKNNLHQVDFSRESVLDRHHKHHHLDLYTQGVISRRFILILEGAASAEFADSNMKFQVGPWEAFGTAILHAIQGNVSVTKFKGSTRSLYNSHNEAVQFIPDFTVTVTTHCKYLQITVPAFLAALKASNIVRDIPRLPHPILHAAPLTRSKISLEEHSIHKNSPEPQKKRAFSTIEPPVLPLTKE